MHRFYCLLALLLTTESSAMEAITPHVRFEEGPVNSVVIQQDGKQLAIYGADSEQRVGIEQVLITHHRRDVVWKARDAMSEDTIVVAPEQKRDLLEMPAEFWEAFTKSRY